MTTYVIVEKRSSEISYIWKSVHICLYLACAVSSMMLSNSMGNIWFQFETNCIFNSQLFFKPSNDSKVLSCGIDNVQTVWSKNYSDCNSHFMIYLLLFCASVIMLTYFIFLNVGSHAASSQMTSSWRILWIATLVNGIAFFVAIFDARSIVRSVLKLCRSFPDAGQPKTFPCTTDCLTYNEMDQSFLSTSFNLLVFLPWLSVFLWGLSFVWCVVRILCHPDFSVYRVVEEEEEWKEKEASTATPVTDNAAATTSVTSDVASTTTVTDNVASTSERT